MMDDPFPDLEYLEVSEFLYEHYEEKHDEEVEPA